MNVVQALKSKMELISGPTLILTAVVIALAILAYVFVTSHVGEDIFVGLVTLMIISALIHDDFKR